MMPPPISSTSTFCSDAAASATNGATARRIERSAEDGPMAKTTPRGRAGPAVAAAGCPRRIAASRERLGALPNIAAGMVGSTRGWREAAYVPAPADLATLAGAATRIEEQRVTIVPGVSLLTDTRADVMRGEEVQVLGAIVAGLAPAD